MPQAVPVLVLFSLFARVEAARISSRFFDANLVETMDRKLQKDCGAPCIRMFHEMVGWLEDNARAVSAGPVSYTHLTLPTICSV